MNNGGPAFPHLGLYPGVDGDLHPTPTQHGGMTLRDWFAGQAMIGLLMRGDWFVILNAAANPEEASLNDTQGAEIAYRLANAMLNARKAQS